MTLDKWIHIRDHKKLVTIDEAAKEIKNKLGLNVMPHNISYLVQYGRINKYKIKNRVFVDIKEVEEYYKTHIFKKREEWEQKLGFKLDWELAFDLVTEKERTKHVHRLHPYKGKFIPQLVEYFLKNYFKPGDIILDPFMGSGTTLVQALEMGIHSIGVDISPFNCLIAEVKLQNYDIKKLRSTLLDMLNKTLEHIEQRKRKEFDEEVELLIRKFNEKYFSQEYRRMLHMGKINEKEYSSRVMQEFYAKYQKLKEKYREDISEDGPFKDKSFLYMWYSPEIREEMAFYLSLINNIEDEAIKKVAMIILSRTARSVRATTHFDLATLKNPVYDPYYCYKHKKICRPVNTIAQHLKKYTYDVIERIEEFSKLRKDAYYAVFQGDSRKIDIEEELEKTNPEFFKLYQEKKIHGIFTSPPYLGQIDYHEQHAYAYELFGFKRFDRLEIGPKFQGTNKKAQEEYIEGISQVLLNMKRFLRKDAKIFIVVNDKRNLYPEIFEKAKMKVIKEFKRPVLNRTSRDRNPYYESIFEVEVE
ncbi:DNA methyltransferase [Methanotorris igneus]|nr:DNA methyltransferase [Methanotorris igneus]